jgi:hypothetical protein
MVTQFTSRRVRRIRTACLLAASSLICGLAAAPPALAAAGHPVGAAAATAKVAPAGAASRAHQSEQQAVAQAHRTGKPVPVNVLTTPTSTTTANPDGTLTVTESLVPVRTWTHGAWRNLSASLVRNPDGTWSPATSTYPLALSGGGIGPLATMTYGGYSLSLTAPMRLPAPVISGATATYAGIMPGVDLIVTAKADGGYSENLRVNNRAAATSTALASLTFTTRTRGVSVAAAANGGLTARNARGQVIFAAPAPRMWDSTVSSQLQKAVASGGTRADAAGLPLRSTMTTPAFGARSARVGVSVAGSRLTLIPDHALLTRADATFPEYIDPAWDSAPSHGAKWAYITSAFPTTPNYGGEADGSNYLQVGEEPGCDPNNPPNCNWDTGDKSYAFYQLPVPSQIEGATSHIYSADVFFPAVWSDSCNPSPIDLYKTSNAISGSTTWNNPPGWSTKLGSDNTAYGWSSSGFGGPSSCATTADEVHFDIKSTISSFTSLTGAIPALNLGLRAESAGVDGWKKFATPDTTVQGNATLTIQYAFAPTKPTLSTSVTGTSCDGTKDAGDGNVTLQATTFDQDGATGNNNVIIPSIKYTAYAGTSPSNTFATNLSQPGSTAGSNGNFSGTAQLLEADLKHALSTYGNAQTQSVKITWTATAQVTLTDPSTQPPTQTTLFSPTATCKFTFTTAQPGAPAIMDDNSSTPDGPSATPCGDNNYPVGHTATFWATPDTSVTPLPDSYIYQLNGGNPVTTDASGKITVTPTRMTNILTVTAVTGGANDGQPATCNITGAQAPTAADQDLTGDGVPDLLTPGGTTTGIASGLWLAAGQGSGGQFDGTVSTTATDLAPYGPQGIDGTGPTPNPAGWTGMKAVTGQFGGPGFNYIEAYTPGSATTPGIYVIPTQGDGSIVTSVQTSQDSSVQSSFDNRPYTSTAGGTATSDFPLQLANAYQASGSDGNAAGYPDEIGIYSDSAVTSFTGITGPGYLAYFQADAGTDGSPGGFDSNNNNGGKPYILGNSSPDGSDWSTWNITSSADSSAPSAGVNLFLWKQSALYLWHLPANTGLTGSDAHGGCDQFGANCLNPTTALAGAPASLPLPATWPTAISSLQATTVSGSLGLITVTSSGAVQSWTVSGTTVTAVGGAQQLSTTDHSYPFTEGTGTTVTDYHGTAGTDPERDLTFHLGTAGSVAWNTGGMFSPDVALNEPTSDNTPTSGGYLTTSAADFSPNSADGWTISAWVNPNALGGTVFSQSGSSYSTVKVGSTTSGQWTVSMNTTGSSYSTVSGGSAQVGLWTQLTVTYDGYLSGSTSQDGRLRLYANGTEVATLIDTSPPFATGAFLVGASQANNVIGSNLNGEVADVQVWDSLAVPARFPGAASIFVPMQPVRILDTRGGTGGITGPVAANATIAVPIAGANGIPATGVTAAAIAITVTGQTSTGYLRVFPDGEPGIPASTVNFTTSGGSAGNDAIVPVGPDGKIAFNPNVSAQIIVDVDGYFSSSATGSTYHPLGAPSRIISTIAGIGVQANTTPLPVAKIPAGAAQGFKIANTSPNGVAIPSNVTAVVLNVSAIAPAGDNGYIIAYPDAGSRPTVSQLQFHGSQTYQDTIVIPVSSTVGTIYLYNGSSQPIDLIGDLSGYFISAGTGQYYHSLDTTRLADTRQTAAIAANATLTVPVPAGINALNPTLILNVTAAVPSAVGYLKVNPSGHNGSGAGIVDFGAAQTIASLSVTGTASNDAIVISNVSAGATDVLLDNDGYFS